MIILITDNGQVDPRTRVPAHAIIGMAGIVCVVSLVDVGSNHTVLERFVFISIVLHSSYKASGTSTIFSRTSMAYVYATAGVLHCKVALAVMAPSSYYGFQTLHPPTLPDAMYDQLISFSCQ